MRLSGAIAPALILAIVASPAIAKKPLPANGIASAHYVAPRAADGVHPDLNGIWQVLNTANWDIAPHPARAALAFRTGPFGPVPAKEVVALGAVGSVPAGLGVVEGGMIPYKPDALATRKDNEAHWLARDPEIKCDLPGVPRATYMPYPFQISQSGKAVLIAYEYAGAVRNIYFKDPGPAPVDSWMGQSFGHWEGDTLVVSVTGLNDSTWFDRAGDFHSDQMTVVEHYTPIAPGVMHYEAEIKDPETFTRPWKMSMNLYRRQGADAQLLQFNCVEFVEELMYGRLRKEPLP